MTVDGQRVVVIGGGISGLAAAHRLARRGKQVTLLEASSQLGGLGTFFRSGDGWVERFYHCIMPDDDHLLRLINDIGLGQEIAWEPTRMGFIYDGARYPFNGPLDLLRFDPISPWQRLRLGAGSLLMRRLGKGEDLDNQRSEDWLRGLYGGALWERLWKPLLQAKFGDHVANVPALYLWQRLGREPNAATRGYPRGGYKCIIDGLESAIRAEGGTVRIDCPVASIREEGSRLSIDLGRGEELEADWGLSTVPLPLLHQMTAGSPLADKIHDPGLDYQGVVNVLLFLARPLDGFYWSPVLQSGTQFDGIVEMSALVDRKRYEGRHLVYLVKYAKRDSRLHSDPEEVIAERWTKQLLELYRDLPLTSDEVLETRVFKAPFVEPIYPLGYAGLKPGTRAGDSHLFLATTAQVYPFITAWNSSVRLAEQVVDNLLDQSALEAQVSGF